MSDKVFVDGLICKRHEKAPEYVLVNLSVKATEFANWLAQNQVNNWVNIAVKRSQAGKLYAELDTFTPNRADQHAAGMESVKAAAQSKPVPSTAENSADWISDDIPF